MSKQMRDKPQLLTICDLCDKEIPEHIRGEEYASVTKGYISHPPDANKVKWWYLLWDPRRWTGSTPSWDRMHKNPRYRTRHYDMHTECLLPLIEHAIALREEADR